MDVDRNKTSWQRLNQELSALIADRSVVDHLTQALHDYVLAERRDAVRAYIESTRP